MAFGCDFSSGVHSRSSEAGLAGTKVADGLGDLFGDIWFSAFNSLFYVAAHHTTAINIGILQGAIPGIVMAPARSFFIARL